MKYIFLFFPLFSLFADPTLLYTLWEEDPCHNLTFVWRDEAKTPLQYSSDGETWIEVEGEPKPNHFYTIALKGLSQGTEYQLRFTNDGNSWKFRTLSEKCETFKAAIGGDIYKEKEEPFLTLTRLAVAEKPDVIILGGDLAYTGSKWSFGSEDEKQWLTFITLLSKQCFTKDNFLIPLMAAIGNHDVNGRYNQTPAQAKGFYQFFRPHHPTGYQSISIGKQIQLLLLDTDHTAPIEGQQTKWLEEQLSKAFPFTFAIYHVPAFPSVRPFQNTVSTKVRTHFVPLFEKYHLTAAFEHHEHAYKRTKPINGVVYIGDGGWGVKNIRKPLQKEIFAHTASSHHIILLSIDNNRCKITALDPNGIIIDTTELTTKTP